MNLEEYRLIFAAGTLALMLLVASPALSLSLDFPDGEAKFSEFWILGPNHMMADYPFAVQVNQTYNFFVGVQNHLHSTIHYLVYVKLRNQTQALPDDLNSTPSPLPPLYEYHVFIKDGETWESPLVFGILRGSRVGDSTLVSDVSINDVVVSVNASATQDSEHNGFYYQLFLELWLYDTPSQNYRFHDRFVGIWFNTTDSF